MKKKVLLIMTLVGILVFNVAAYGAIREGEEITPLYDNVLNPISSLTMSGASANCKSTCTMTKNHPSKITMTLQKSSDKSTYSKVTAWSQEYTGTGTKSLSKTKVVTKGYYYRVRTVVCIYSGSTVIEKVTKYSNVVYY